MSKKLATVHIEAIVYSKDTDGEYILDTNDDKIVEKTGLDVVPSDDYDYIITITEYYWINYVI